MTEHTETCINCGCGLIHHGSVLLCPNCNSDEIDQSHVFLSADDASEYVIIECPGVSLYEPGTTTVAKGVRFIEDESGSERFEIVEEQIYAPTHRRYRRIKREALGKIRRCHGCQDYTVRQRRREGPDFYIPSSKHPDRNKLRSMTHVTKS